MEEKVLECLKNSAEPMKTAEIATSLGIDKADVDKAIKKLKAEGKVDSPKRCFYAAV